MVKRLIAVRSVDSVTVSWAHDGYGPPLHFEVEVQPDSSDWSALATVGYVDTQTQYSYVHTSPIGSSVRYRVRAANTVGESPWVESNSVPLVLVPSAPTDVSAE